MTAVAATTAPVTQGHTKAYMFLMNVFGILLSSCFPRPLAALTLVQCYSETPTHSHLNAGVTDDFACLPCFLTDLVLLVCSATVHSGSMLRLEGTSSQCRLPTSAAPAAGMGTARLCMANIDGFYGVRAVLWIFAAVFNCLTPGGSQDHCNIVVMKHKRLRC